MYTMQVDNDYLRGSIPKPKCFVPFGGRFHSGRSVLRLHEFLVGVPRTRKHVSGQLQLSLLSSPWREAIPY
jgi:hypothetical protein